MMCPWVSNCLCITFLRGNLYRLIALFWKLKSTKFGLLKDLFQSDLVCNVLGRVEDLDGCLIVQDVTLGRRQDFEDLALDVAELTLVVGGLDDESVSLVLEFRAFSRHHDAEQLVPETLLRYHEIQQRHLHAQTTAQRHILYSPSAVA